METEKRKPSILVLDDERSIRQSIQMALSNIGFEVHAFHEPLGAFQFLAANPVDLAILDIRLGEIDGLTVYQKILSDDLDLPTVFVSGHASLTEAARAVQMGAFDFLEKPFTTEKLAITVSRCLEYSALKKRWNQVGRGMSSSEILGESNAIAKVKDQIALVATSDSTVFIGGESGTGKELIANAIHARSKRKDRDFVKVNCSAIPENLIESELFGYERGAFTGANQSKRGMFEIANHGTLFLDEIGDLSLSAQAKVLRALQNGEIQRLGSEKVTKVNVRVLAASHKDLKSEVAEGRFRQDLLYRINVIPISSPPLRQRAEDIPILCRFFLDQICQRNGMKIKNLDAGVLMHLQAYSWPGNVRELQNIIERLAIMGGETIKISDLPEEIYDPRVTAETGVGTRCSLRQARDRAERDYIIETLRFTKGNVTQAAKILDVERTYLHKRLNVLEIQKRDYFV